MKKSTKGAIAAVAGAFLLMGGAGTIAFWNAEVNLAGPGTITAGELKLADENCADGWVFDEGEDQAGKAYESSDLLVPGDVLTKECTYRVVATGEHLRAELSATGGTATGALPLDVDASFVVDGKATNEITEAANGQTLTARMTVEFPYGDKVDNSSQKTAANLDDYVVTLTQVHD